MALNNIVEIELLTRLLHYFGYPTINRYLEQDGLQEMDIRAKILTYGIVQSVQIIMNAAHAEDHMPPLPYLHGIEPLPEFVDFVHGIDEVEQLRGNGAIAQPVPPEDVENQERGRVHEHRVLQAIGEEVPVPHPTYHETHKVWKMIPELYGSDELPHDTSYLIDSISALKMQDMSVAIFIHQGAVGGTFEEILKNPANRRYELNMLFAYNNSTANDLLEAWRIRDTHRLYMYNKFFPNTVGDIHERYDHMAKLFMIYLILSATHYKQDKMELQVYMNYHKNSVTSQILRYILKDIYPYLLQELELIVANPGCLFCYNCNQDCRFAMKPWHFNLALFTRRQFTQPPVEATNNFIMKTDLWRNDMAKELEFYKQLRIAKQQHRTISWNFVLELLDALNRRSMDIKQMFDSYLLLLVNDDNPDLKTPAKQLFSEAKEYFVYIGHTKEGPYRKSHFHANSVSDLGRMPLKTTRIFQLRRYSTPKLLDVLYDESYVFVQLKAIRHIKHQNYMDTTFQIVNQNSIAYSMMGCSLHRYTEIDAFARSQVPIFNDEGYANAPTIVERSGHFTGNYNLHEITQEVHQLHLPPEAEAKRTQHRIRVRNISRDSRTANIAFTHYPFEPENADVLDD